MYSGLSRPRTSDTKRNIFLQLLGIAANLRLDKRQTQPVVLLGHLSTKLHSGRVQWTENLGEIFQPTRN